MVGLMLCGAVPLQQPPRQEVNLESPSWAFCHCHHLTSCAGTLGKETRVVSSKALCQLAGCAGRYFQVPLPRLSALCLLTPR